MLPLVVGDVQYQPDPVALASPGPIGAVHSLEDEHQVEPTRVIDVSDALSGIGSISECRSSSSTRCCPTLSSLWDATPATWSTTSLAGAIVGSASPARDPETSRHESPIDRDGVTEEPDDSLLPLGW